MDLNHPEYPWYNNSGQIPQFSNSEYYPDYQFSPNLNQIPASQFVSSEQNIFRNLFSDVPRPNQNQRGAKNAWCVKEDVAQSWVFASEDSVIGRNQKGINLWARIHKLYHEHQANNPDELNERNIEAMKGRWKRLNENANKWIAACKEASARKKSGMSQKDIEKEAHTIVAPQTPKHQLFAQHQESCRKDVERAFGVLQARFAFLRRPCLVWDKELMGKIMMACIILHNMIVEDERDTYLNYYDPSEFLTDIPTRVNDEDGESLQFSTERITSLSNYIVNRDQLRNRDAHFALRNELIEHIWFKFGTN